MPPASCGRPRTRGRARCRRAEDGTSYQPGAISRVNSRSPGKKALALHWRHLYPLSRPALVMREPQEEQNGLSRTTFLTSPVTPIFSRFREFFLNEPVTTILSPGSRPRMTCRNCFVGSNAMQVTVLPDHLNPKVTCPPFRVTGRVLTVPEIRYE